MQSTSSLFKLDWIDAWKTFRGALLIGIGYVLTQGLDVSIQNITSGAVDLGQYQYLQGILVTVLSSVLELVRRFLADHTK